MRIQDILKNSAGFQIRITWGAYLVDSTISYNNFTKHDKTFIFIGGGDPRQDLYKNLK
jgi:hypothetical protein